MTSKPFRITDPFFVTVNDYINASRLYARRNWHRQIPNWVAFVLLSALGIQVVANSIERLKISDILLSLPLLFGVRILIALALYHLVVPVSARWTYRRLTFLRSPCIASWDATGFTGSNADFSSTIPWGDYYAWCADKQVIALLQAPNLFQIIPRHALSDAQAADLIDQIKRGGVKAL